MWFQQDGATCHTAREALQLLHVTFPGRALSRFGYKNGSPRSYDLTPLDLFLWGYFNSMQSWHCQLSRKQACISGENQWNSATFMRNGLGKFRQKSASIAIEDISSMCYSMHTVRFNEKITTKNQFFLFYSNLALSLEHPLVSSFKLYYCSKTWFSLPTYPKICVWRQSGGLTQSEWRT